MATEPERLEAPARAVVRLQPARWDDRDLVLAWRNDPALWQAGNGRPVTPGEHAVWWRDHAMDAARCRLWLVRANGVLVGTLRFDREDRVARVTLYLVTMRGQGIGTRAFRWAWSHRPVWAESAVAEVQDENTGARRFWEALGFVDDGRRNGRLLLRYRP